MTGERDTLFRSPTGNGNFSRVVEGPVRRRCPGQVRTVGKRRFVLVRERGEDLIETVTSFLEEKDVRGGFVTGLGAITNHTLAWFDVEKKEYLKRTFEENMELGNLTGSVSMVEGKPFLHAHVTVSGPELIAFSGHLVRGEVAVTAELLLTVFEEGLVREKDEETGLSLLVLEPPIVTENGSND
jgi:predicted DNA-binding protein with PD1-like motif